MPVLRNTVVFLHGPPTQRTLTLQGIISRDCCEKSRGSQPGVVTEEPGVVREFNVVRTFLTTPWPRSTFNHAEHHGYDGDRVMTVGYYRLPNVDGTSKYCQDASEVAVGSCMI